MLPKSVLKKMAIELRAKTNAQLNNLLNIYQTQLRNLNEQNYKLYSEPIKQKISLIEQELRIRQSQKISTVQ